MGSKPSTSNNEYVLPEGEVIVTRSDAEGIFTYANEGFLRSTGFALDEVIGRSQKIIYHPDMPDEVNADLWATLQGGRPWTACVKNRRRDGGFFWARADVSPIIEKGRVAGYTAVRVKASANEVAKARAAYAAMRSGRAAHLAIEGGVVVRADLWGRLLHGSSKSSLGMRLWLAAGLLAAMFIAIAVLAEANVSGGALGGLWSLCAFGIAMAIFAGSYFNARLVRPLSTMTKVAERIAGGDLQARFEEIGETDLRRLARAVNQMNAKLVGVLIDAHSSLDRVVAATDEVSRGSTELSGRTEAQASSLEQTAASMEEMNETVGANAENARAAAALSAGASRIAQRGGEAVRAVVATMSAISESSQKISDIIGVIDSIAFQTNILALNAAVEAARAGEQGRGFAVVAAEVRSLAQRSAGAAKEIKMLIGESAARVEAGGKQVEDAGRTMDEIVQSVQRASGLVAEITQASQEQTQGIAQVTETVAQLEKTTQQNASMVEQVTNAVATLRAQADQILAAMTAFRVRA